MIITVIKDLVVGFLSAIISRFIVEDKGINLEDDKIVNAILKEIRESDSTKIKISVKKSYVIEREV